MTVSVTVDSGLTVHSPELAHGLMRGLSIANPAYLAAAKASRAPWQIPRELCFAVDGGDHVRIPRGAAPILRSVAAQAGVALAIEDRRILPPERLELRAAPTLRQYQELAVDALAKRQQGVFVFPCGAGKTRAAMGAIARLGTPTLILVASLDLAAQWAAEIREHVGADAGIVGGGAETVAPVTVALVQTLSRWDTAKLDGFLARFGLLIIDEAHHVAAATFLTVVDRCPAKYRLALTATPEREDGLGPVITWFCGSAIATVTHDELIAAGTLIAPDLRVLETDFRYLYRSADDYGPMLEALVADDGRNALIVAAVAAEAQAGQSVLVLTGRVAHCAVLADALTERGVRAAALTGGKSKRQRAQILEDARNGKISVVIATSLADEGLDLPRLSRVVLAYPSRARGRAEQRFGRIMRPHPAKTDAVVIDVVDAHVSLLRRQHRERAATFCRVMGAA